MKIVEIEFWDIIEIKFGDRGSQMDLFFSGFLRFFKH